MRHEIVFATLLVLLLAVTPVAAQEAMESDGAVQDAAPGLQRQPLPHAMAAGAVVGCHIEKALTLIDALEAYAPDALDVTELRAVLQKDREAVAAAETRAELKESRKAAREHLKQARDLLKTLRRQGRKITRENRKKLREVKRLSRDAFHACRKQMLAEAGRSRAEKFGERAEKWAAKAERLAQKGRNVSAMRDLAGEMRTALGPLKEAVASGDPEAIRTAAKDVRMQYLHFWARFHIARLQVGVDYAAEQGADVSAVQDMLDAAAELAAPGRRYGESEHKELRSMLKDAARSLRDLLKSLRGGAQ